MTSEPEPNDKIADLTIAIGKLWKSVEALRAETNQKDHDIHDTLDEWVKTNQGLISNLIANSQIIKEYANTYKSSTDCLINLEEQQRNSNKYMPQLGETLTGLTNFHQSIKSSHESMDAMSKYLQSAQTEIHKANTTLQKLDRRILTASRRSGVSLWMWGIMLAIVLVTAIGNLIVLRASSDRINTVLDEIQSKAKSK